MRIVGRAQPRAAPEEGILNDTRVLRRPRLAWLPDVLIAAAIIAPALLAAVACGSGPSSAGASAAKT
jgi:hypothetical protein